MLEPGEFLSPLVELNKRAAGDHVHDVHFRRNDEVHIYRGLTRLLTVRRLKTAGVKVQANDTYSSHAQGLVRTWHPEEGGFREALLIYLSDVQVNASHLDGEGAIQTAWAQVTEPWVPFDREAVLSHGKGYEVDQLAVDSNGRLVIIELKDASKQKVYDAPHQLQRYVWKWHRALKRNPGIWQQLQAVIEARIKLRLTSELVNPLSHGIRAVVGFGLDARCPEVKRRYERVLNVVNAHLPPEVGPIETWALNEKGVPHEVGTTL